MLGRRIHTLHLVTLCAGGVLVVTGACGGGTASRAARFQSGNPLDRAQAVIEATEARDLEAVHTLVDLLEDPDPAVRMFAIVALRRLCDRDYGYRYYEDAYRRAQAVERWRTALRQGEIAVVSRAAPSAPEAARADTSPQERVQR